MRKKSSRRAKQQARQAQRSDTGSNSRAEHIRVPGAFLADPNAPTLVEKRVRISWDFSVTIKDIDPESVRRDMEAHLRASGQDHGLDLMDSIEAQAEMQRTLHHAVLTQPGLLERFLRNAMGELLIDDAHDNLIIEGGQEEILAPAIATLSMEEREFLQEAADEGFFDENTQQFADAILVSAGDLKLEEVQEARST